MSRWNFLMNGCIWLSQPKVAFLVASRGRDFANLPGGVEFVGNPYGIPWVFPNIGVGPPNHPFVHRVFHYKPSILGAHPYFWKHPYGPLLVTRRWSIPSHDSECQRTKTRPIWPQKVAFWKGNPRNFQGNLAWWNIIIWSDFLVPFEKILATSNAVKFWNSQMYPALRRHLQV